MQIGGQGCRDVGAARAAVKAFRRIRLGRWEGARGAGEGAREGAWLGWFGRRHVVLAGLGGRVADDEDTLAWFLHVGRSGAVVHGDGRVARARGTRERQDRERVRSQRCVEGGRGRKERRGPRRESAARRPAAGRREWLREGGRGEGVVEPNDENSEDRRAGNCSQGTLAAARLVSIGIPTPASHLLRRRRSPPGLAYSAPARPGRVPSSIPLCTHELLMATLLRLSVPLTLAAPSPDRRAATSGIGPCARTPPAHNRLRSACLPDSRVQLTIPPNRQIINLPGPPRDHLIVVFVLTPFKPTHSRFRRVALARPTYARHRKQSMLHTPY